jgi:hypothetical protein
MKDILFFRGRIIDAEIEMPNIDIENFKNDLRTYGVRLWFGIKEKDIKELTPYELIRMLDEMGIYARWKVEEWEQTKKKVLKELQQKK